LKERDVEERGGPGRKRHSARAVKKGTK
jgi:hypothetical protein